MKKNVAWIIGIIAVTALNIGAQTVVPSAFNYQGVLRNGDGTAIGAGNQQVEFKLYNEATGGSAVWGRMYTVVLDVNGLFNVELEDDNGTQLIDSSLLDVIGKAQGQLFIGITVEEDAEIAPRQQLLSVPYALMAGDVHEARSNFTVNGELSVTNGAVVSGTVQADQMIIDSGDYQTTLTVNSSRSLTTSEGLHVNGNVAIKGDTILVGKGSTQATIAGKTDGSIHLHNKTYSDSLEVTGETQLFSRNPSIINDWTEYVEGGSTLIPAAVSDGFVLISVFWHFNLNKNDEVNFATLVANFITDNQTTRGFEMRLGIEDIDSDHTLSIKDVFTYPILKGETLQLTNTDTYELDENSYVKYRYTFIPFGTEK